MLVVLSPAKKLDFETETNCSIQTEPQLLEKTNLLSKELKKLSTAEISKLMKLSPTLSELNYKRFQSFKNKYNPSTSKQAVFAFNGDTYTGLNIKSFNKNELKSVQKNIRILSGLYGILKPMDLIQPYRLEMGTKYKFNNYKNLYEYWKEDVTALINKELKSHNNTLVNCASQEYFSLIDKDQLKGDIITPVFKEKRNGEYKIISFSAKKARGMMANFIVKNNITDIDGVKKFNLDNYKFSKSLSNDFELVFTR